MVFRGVLSHEYFLEEQITPLDGRFDAIMTMTVPEQPICTSYIQRHMTIAILDFLGKCSLASSIQVCSVFALTAVNLCCWRRICVAS